MQLAQRYASKLFNAPFLASRGLPVPSWLPRDAAPGAGTGAGMGATHSAGSVDGGGGVSAAPRDEVDEALAEVRVEKEAG